MGRPRDRGRELPTQRRKERKESQRRKSLHWIFFFAPLHLCAFAFFLVFTSSFALGQSDDPWQVPVLEEALDSRLRAIADFPAPLYPPDLEQEIAASLEELARLDPDSAALRARSLLEAGSRESELTWTARRVLAASGDLGIIRLGLRSYFEAPARWTDVLAASDDPRLRDFGGESGPEPLSGRNFLTTLERNLSRARERASIRALLTWASASADSSSPRRVLQALPEGIPLEAAVRAWLRRNSQPAEAPEPPLFPGGEPPFEIKQRVMALSPDARYRAIRWLAERDQEVLTSVPVSREQIDRLYPYFARSSRRTLRDRVRHAERARGRALASLLLSPAAGGAEKAETLRAMPDAWAGAIATAVPEVFEIMSSLLPQEDLERFLSESEVDEAFLDALAILPIPEARLRLEALGTKDAVERLVRRSDRFLSVPALSRLRREGEPLAARSASLVLLTLGAPGASAWLRAELANLSDPAEVLLVLTSSTIFFGETSIAAGLSRRMASEPSPSPAAFAALSRMHELAPGALVALTSAGLESVRDRAYFAMSVSGDPRFLPLLVDLAVGPVPGASRASRDAAFTALAAADLGPFATRLHRLAGDPDREVRLRAAAVLVPSGEAWTLRLLLGNADPSSFRERAIARGAVQRLPRKRAEELLEEMADDGTAGSFGVLLYLELSGESEVRRSRPLQEKLWGILAEDARAGDEAALLAASRLSHPEAIAVVTGRLSAP